MNGALAYKEKIHYLKLRLLVPRPHHDTMKMNKKQNF